MTAPWFRRRAGPASAPVPPGRRAGTPNPRAPRRRCGRPFRTSAGTHGHLDAVQAEWWCRLTITARAGRLTAAGDGGGGDQDVRLAGSEGLLGVPLVGPVPVVEPAPRPWCTAARRVRRRPRPHAGGRRARSAASASAVARTLFAAAEHQDAAAVRLTSCDRTASAVRRRPARPFRGVGRVGRTGSCQVRRVGRQAVRMRRRPATRRPRSALATVADSPTIRTCERCLADPREQRFQYGPATGSPRRWISSTTRQPTSASAVAQASPSADRLELLRGRHPQVRGSRISPESTAYSPVSRTTRSPRRRHVSSSRSSSSVSDRCGTSQAALRPRLCASSAATMPIGGLALHRWRHHHQMPVDSRTTGTEPPGRG